jgi:hypothetical protein
MKKLFVILTVTTIAFWGCGKVEPNKAKALVESLIHKEDSGKYAETSNYYSEEFNQSASLEARTEKYQKLKEVFGDVVSMECIKVKGDTTDFNDRPILQLVYRIKHTKLTSLEAFTVVSQNGDYKVEQDDIKQQ